ncbi:MAG: sulfatase [Promethearchaeota archaeon]
MPYGNGLLILKSQYLGFIAFMFGAIVFIPFIYNGIKKFYATGLLNIVQKRAFLNISVLTGVALLIGNLIIVINQKESRPEGPNVVFIVIDALRADHLSSYGYNRLSSPNIDKLSIDGIRFTNAISQGNRTSLSMPSMLTGLYTSDHGYNMLQKIESRIVPLSARFASIGEVLRNAGYITYAASCQPWISPESGYGQGFDYFEMVSSLGDNLSDEKTVKKALDWLDDNRDEKFFIFLDLMGPHTPYDPPKPYKSLYSSGHEVRSKLISDLNDLYFKEKYGEYYKLLLNTSKENISTEDLKQLIELYDAKIAFTDQQIGSLIEKLKSLNIYDNTLIILTADHGEAFLDHDKFLHGRSVYNEEVHVPLIMTCLDRLPKNKEIDDIVELVDILPTIASISGIPISEIKMRGNPLFPIKGNSYDSDQFAYTEGSGHIKYMTNQWSIICEIGSGECELYDLESDPGETYNLSGMKPDIVTNLKNKLFDIIDEKMYPSFQEAKTIRIPEKTKKTLKSLGYLQ